MSFKETIIGAGWWFASLFVLAFFSSVWCLIIYVMAKGLIKVIEVM